ncbi:hypothetical protein Tco_0750921, partial [Tanacetum coccineum]
YSQNSKAYIILNKHTRKVEESLNVTFDETPPPSKTSPLVDDDLDEEEAIKVTEMKNLENDIEDETLEIDEIVNIKESRNHPLENAYQNALMSYQQAPAYPRISWWGPGSPSITDFPSINKLCFSANFPFKYVSLETRGIPLSKPGQSKTFGDVILASLELGTKYLEPRQLSEGK